MKLNGISTVTGRTANDDGGDNVSSVGETNCQNAERRHSAMGGV